MKIWLTKNSEISVKDQLIAQMQLGIVSGDLPIGEKLPSTKEISRRFQIHANTVATAYQEMVEKGWIQFRQGKGFFVLESKPDQFSNKLDQLISQFVQTAQTQGFTLSDIQNRLSHFFEFTAPDHLLLIENNEDLRKILVAEIAEATNFKVLECSFEQFQQNPKKTGAIFVALLDEAVKINAVLPVNKTCVFLKIGSVADSMKGQTRPPSESLIAIVSGWQKFLLLAKTMLLAAQIDSESIITRATDELNWERGLNETTMIICDSLTSKQLQEYQQVKVFKFIAQNSIEELLQTIK